MTDDSNPGRRHLRRIGLVVAGLVLATGLIVAVIHTPPVRRLVLRFAVAEVQRRYGIRLEAARLDYNLASLTVGLAQLRVAADRSPAVPFFEADYVQASLRRRAFLAVISFDQVNVTGGRVRIAFDREGR